MLSFFLFKWYCYKVSEIHICSRLVVPDDSIAVRTSEITPEVVLWTSKVLLNHSIFSKFSYDVIMYNSMYLSSDHFSSTWNFQNPKYAQLLHRIRNGAILHNWPQIALDRTIYCSAHICLKHVKNGTISTNLRTFLSNISTSYPTWKHWKFGWKPWKETINRDKRKQLPAHQWSAVSTSCNTTWSVHVVKLLFIVFIWCFADCIVRHMLHCIHLKEKKSYYLFSKMENQVKSISF